MDAFFLKWSFYHLSGLQCTESNPTHEKTLSLIQLQLWCSKLVVPNNPKTSSSVRKQTFNTTVESITNLSSPWPLTYPTTPFPLHRTDYLILWQTLSTPHFCSWTQDELCPHGFWEVTVISDSFPSMLSLYPCPSDPGEKILWSGFIPHWVHPANGRFHKWEFLHREKDSSLYSWDKVSIALKVTYEILNISQNSTWKANCKTETDLSSQCK